MSQHVDEGLRRIQFDPFSAVAAPHWGSSPKAAVAVPWPAAQAPKPIKAGYSANTPLPEADALVVTWTSGEARTMGQLFAGTQLEDWIEYKHNVSSFIPIVTGSQAPFNYNGAENARYYHTLGLYTLVELAGKKIVVLKSGLHPAYDGPHVPMMTLWQQMIAEVKPKLVITTGTGGGIGSDVLLGDVVIAKNFRFDCTGQFKAEPWSQSAYACAPVDEMAIERLITPALLKPNGQRLMTPRTPNMIYPSAPAANVVTTDTFAFDDSSDYYGLQGKGKCCDMGDAVLGLAMSGWVPPKGIVIPSFVAIRNASDPQIENSQGKAGLSSANKKAEQIYNDYQCITTAGSVIATWATLLAQL
jgi:nucleoside phosphorylase